MSRKSQDPVGRTFSIELRSAKTLRSASFVHGSDGEVEIEGTLGTLESVSFPEGMVLQIVGSEGTLQVDLEQDEIPRPRRVPRP